MRAPILLAIGIATLAAAGVTLFEDCDLWLSEKQCIENPNFMWTSCSTACLRSKDSHEKCAEWAAEGECTANPHFIQTNCPEACGHQLAWNPYLRNEMRFDALQPPNGASAEVGKSLLESLLSCPVVDMMQVADAMRHRVQVYLSGGANMPSLGLSSSSPTEFLGVYGLVEAVLYGLRVYHAIITGSAHAGATQAVQAASSARIDRVLQALTQARWTADSLMRQIPQFGDMLKDAAADSRAALGLDSQGDEAAEGASSTCSASGEPRPPVQALSAHLTLLNERGSEIKSSAAPHAGAEAIAKPPTVLLPALPSAPAISMPLLGLGTWQLNGPECEDAVYLAIQLGYRHIDSAEAYGNEEDVGRAVQRAIADGLVTRAELFVATKVSVDSSARDVRAHVRRQLRSLGVDYIDLYYLHSPMGDAIMRPAWAALEAMCQEGLIRALAVSNFDKQNLEFFASPAVQVQPAVLQNKFDLYHHGKQLDNQGDDIFFHARDRGLVLLSYSPFSSYPFALEPAFDPVVLAIAQRLPPLPLATAEAYLPSTAHPALYALYPPPTQPSAMVDDNPNPNPNRSVPITPAMVLLKWTLQLGLASIPRSTNQRRLLENLLAGAMPDLAPADVEMLSSLHLLTSSPLCIAV